MINGSVNSHPLKDLTLTLHARSFQYRNSTPELALTNFVISDRSVAAGDTSATRPYTKTNADFSAGYRLPAQLQPHGWLRVGAVAARLDRAQRPHHERSHAAAEPRLHGRRLADAARLVSEGLAPRERVQPDHELREPVLPPVRRGRPRPRADELRGRVHAGRPAVASRSRGKSGTTDTRTRSTACRATRASWPAARWSGRRASGS